MKNWLKYSIDNKKRNLFYNIGFIVSCFLLVWEVNIYRDTFVDLYIPLLIILIVGLLATFLDLDNYRKTYTYKKNLSLFFAWITNTFIWGFTACTLFMASNYYLADSQVKKVSFNIEKTGSLQGSRSNRSKRKPYFTILYKGTLKDIHFSNHYYRERKTYSQVILEIQTGLWNLDVITNKSVK